MYRVTEEDLKTLDRAVDVISERNLRISQLEDIIEDLKAIIAHQIDVEKGED